ncbi:MAG TPA: efflux RND transporter permease subunit [Pseudomonadota bacterium]|nr:efflux RND transporter permease subunit [Pseudomonadota bacterium]HRA36706.1 efflux RND transporter permease subunit [Pseudomonadota bacterium]
MGPNLSDWALKHRSFVVFLMIAATIAGLGSYASLGRNEDPAFTFRAMVVFAAWPGATLEDTVEQVTERIERTLQETPNLDFIRSTTTAGVTTIFVNLKGSTPPEQVPDIWYHVRKSVGDMRHTLPQGVVGPGFNDEFGDTFGLIYGFTADGFSQRELRDYVEDARSKLLNVPDVSKIELLGAQDETIFIEFSVKQLAGLGLNQAALLNALRAQNVIRPSGTVQTEEEKLWLRVSGVFDSEEDILAVNFVHEGRLVRLRDIATVRRGFADPPQPLFRVNGQPSIGLAIAMAEGGDILALGDNVDRAMAEIAADLPVGIEPVLVANQPDVVDEAINEFMVSLWQAIGIILVISFLALGVRAGTVVALSFPLTLAIVFPIMQSFEIDLQRISLGALIIALSLLVDNAMTMVDSFASRMDAGDSKEKAASFAYQTLAFPMLTGTFITAAGFVPIGFAASSAGEYTFSIFAVVTIALLVSWFVAVVFFPLLCVWLLKQPDKPATGELGPVMRVFRALLVAAMRLRWVTIAATVGVFVLAILAAPMIPRQFFPASDRPELVVDLRLPQSASIYRTDTMAAEFDRILAEDPDVERWSTYVGRGAIRFYLPLDVQLSNDFFSQVVIVAKDVEARQRLEVRLEKLLAERFPESVSRVAPLELGPPVGWPVQYRVSGPDLAQVRSIALEVAAIMAANDNLRRVNYDWMEGARTVRIDVDQDQARLLGVSSEALAGIVNTVVTGVPVTQVRDDIFLVNVVARAQGDQRTSIASLRTLQVPLPSGRTVPLSQIATLSFEQESPLIWRRDRVPTLTVRADLVPGMLPETVVAAVQPAIDNLNKDLPRGYEVVVGGTVEESANSQASVAAVVPVMVFLMLFFLMVQLQSFNRMALVLSVIPLGMIGVVGALLASGRPLGFVAILGILALIGMIARNAVLLIEQIDSERAAGKAPWDAVIDSTISRFRPIMLTAISTVLGMIPIAGTVFWGPMAFTIMGGLLVATILTLIFLPALYVAWFRIKRDDPGMPAPATAGAAAVGA